MSDGSRFNRRYSPEEVEFITRNYASRGPRWIAKRLKRTSDGIKNFAWRNSILGRVATQQTIRVVDLALELEMDPTNIYITAEREGVIRRHGRQANGKAVLVVVPRSWAREYTSRKPVDRKADAEAAGWVSLVDAAEVIGVSREALSLALRGRYRLGRLFEDAGVEVRVVRSDGAGPPSRMIRREVVEAVKDALDEMRRLARERVTVKALAVELRVTAQAVRYRAERRGIELVILPVGAAWMQHVTVEEAERIRTPTTLDTRRDTTI